jgi:hypothetical protein
MKGLKGAIAREKGVKWKLHHFVQSVSTFTEKARKGEPVMHFQRVSLGRL